MCKYLRKFEQLLRKTYVHTNAFIKGLRFNKLYMYSYLIKYSLANTHDTKDSFFLAVQLIAEEIFNPIPVFLATVF